MNHIIIGKALALANQNKADWTLGHKQLEWANKYIPTRYQL